MEYEYRLVDRDLAVDGVKRLLPDIVWKIANTELVEGIGLPEVKMICDGKTTEGMTVKEVITVHNLKRAMQFMLANLDRPVDLNDFLYKTSIGIMPGGLTMEKTREIEERNRKWLGLE